MKGIICIGLYAGGSNSTGPCPLSDKLELLKRCYASAAREGMPVAIIATGDEAGVEAVRKAVPEVPLYGCYGYAGDKQRGEAAIGVMARKAAVAHGADWIVKVAADCHFPTYGWASAFIEAAQVAGKKLAATAHSRPEWVTTQAWCATVEFLEVTWPGPESDFSAIGIEAVWGQRIRDKGRLLDWRVLPSVHIAADGTENWVPEAAALRYSHAHTLASASGWALASAPTVDADRSINISVVIPARDENQVDHAGRYLLARTVESIEQTSIGMPMPEIIGIDDGSAGKLPWPDRYAGKLRVIRNGESLGVDPARNIGIFAARGDCVGILDGHMAVQGFDGTPCINGIQRLAALAMQRNALVVARCAHLEMPSHNGHPALCGGDILPLDSPKSQLALAWKHIEPPVGIHPVNAVLGASYFMPRALWIRTGGFVNDCRCWGYSEEGLSIKAAFMGIPVLCFADVTIAHWFRPNGPHPFPVDPWHKTANRGKVLRVTFGDKAFSEVWLPRLRLIEWDARMEESMKSHSILSEAARFDAVKVRSDSEVLRDLFKLEWT